MKLQCSCGAKYTFEVTPEMAHQPVHFVCSTCGVDASEFVTQLVRKQFAADNPAIAPPPSANAPAPAAIAPPPSTLAPPMPAIAPPPSRNVPPPAPSIAPPRSEEHTSALQPR